MGRSSRAALRASQCSAQVGGGFRTLACRALLAVLLAMASGCTDDEPRADLPTPPTTAGPSSPAGTGGPAQTDEAAVINQYRRFLVVAYTNWPAAERRSQLTKVLADPALTIYMTNLARMDRAGEILFGKLVSRDPRVTISGEDATVVDCQDSSGSGRKKESTGDVLSSGVPRVEATVTFVRGDDDVWRVSEVEYGSTSC